MKKRKELDALLLNNMNGKKISKSSNGKEGHELLRNEASWDSNSTENEDFFSPPRKMMIRTPHRWRFCATCVQLGVFVVMVACIVVTGGLIWMHLDLKQDLDELRLRIAKVESSLETSTEQASTVSTLLSKIEQLQNLPAQISSIYTQIETLNKSTSQLQVQIKVASSITTLQKTTAQFGSTMQGVQGLQAQHSEQLETLTSSIAGLKSSLSDLQGEVTKMHPTTPAPSESIPTPKPAPTATNPTADTKTQAGSADFMSVKTVIQSLQQGLDGVSSAVSQLNDSMVSIKLWKQDLMPKIVALESASSRGTLDLNLAEKVNQLQTQVNALMGSLHNQTVESGVQTPIQVTGNEQTAWHQDMESRLQTIQSKLNELNLNDLSANLQDLNTTQDQMQDAFEKVQKDNLKAITDLQQEDSGLWGRLLQQHNDIMDIQEEVASILNNLGVTGPPVEQTPHANSKAVTTEASSMSSTTDNLQPVTIHGIATLNDLEIAFFKWDKNVDESVSYDELKEFLGPGAPPEDVLMHFDKDGNGKWSLAEMKTALGLPEQ